MYGITRILATLTKKTSEAVRAQTCALQEKGGVGGVGGIVKGFVVVRLTHCIFFEGSGSSSNGGVYFYIYEYKNPHYYLKC